MEMRGKQRRWGDCMEIPSPSLMKEFGRLNEAEKVWFPCWKVGKAGLSGDVVPCLAHIF